MAAKCLPSMAIAAILMGAAGLAQTQYPKMAPVDQYLMERNAEIALARSAAPESISRDAQVLIMGRHGYETAAKGTNGFVCIVQRSWTAGVEEPDFWNPKVRAPICFNAAGARSYMQQAIKRTEWILAGRSKDEMFEALKAAVQRKELPTTEPGAMCYMMSKQGHLNDRGGHWHPHVMIFAPLAEQATWGENLDGSPMIGATDPEGGVAIFMMTVRHWSDGTDSGA